jgi:tetratricopeptide (TPR) repeat protein
MDGISSYLPWRAAMRKCFSILAFVAAICTLPATAQVVNLSVIPTADIPFGPTDSTGKSLYTFGGGMTLTGDIPLPFAPLFFAQGLIGVDLLGVNASSPQSMSLASFGAGVGMSLKPLPQLGVKLAVDGGYGLGFYKGSSGGAAFVQAGVSASYFFTPSFSLGLGAAYRNCFGFYEGIGAFLSGTFQLGGGSKSRVEIKDIRLSPVFPVFHTYYNTHPLGRVTIKNGESGPIQEAKVSFFAKQYMDSPKLCATVGEMNWGEERTIDLVGLFTDRILKVTEGTEVNAEIVVEYRYLSEDRTTSATSSLPVNNRNAMTWDDDRKAASFVTYRDPGVAKFAKWVGGLAREEGNSAVNLNLREALAVFEALGLYGMNYVADPKSSYAEAAKNPTGIDSLQFPIQTLSYRAGDCDDLSILCCAMLESIAIDTAFVTVPGHIFMAFSLDLPPDEAKKAFNQPDDLIFQKSDSWVPVEITMVQEGFLKAWQKGAQEWRESAGRGEAKFYPMAASWELYAPTGIESDESLVMLPRADQVSLRFRLAMEKFVDRQIDDGVSRLRDDIARSHDDPALINKLGVLYARYGRFDKAEVELKRAAEKNYVPATVNLGNVYFQKKQMDTSLVWFRRAAAIDPTNASALLGLSKVSYELENYGLVKETYKKLQALNPALAERFSYLVSSRKDGAGRAGEAPERSAVSWDTGE